MSTPTVDEVDASSAEVEHAYKMFDYACRFNEDAYLAYIAWSEAKVAYTDARQAFEESTA
jgi:hypothetical protein